MQEWTAGVMLGAVQTGNTPVHPLSPALLAQTASSTTMTGMLPLYLSLSQLPINFAHCKSLTSQSVQSGIPTYA